MTWRSFRHWWAVAFVAGVVAGVLWWAVADTATFTITKDGIDLPDDQLRQQFGVIAKFVLIGAVCSLVFGLAVAFVSRVSWVAVPAVALMTAQSAVLAWLIGGLLGPGQPSLDGAVGARISDDLGVDAVAPFLAWAMFGVAGLLLGIWLFEREPEEAPGDS